MVDCEGNYSLSQNSLILYYIKKYELVQVCGEFYKLLTLNDLASEKKPASSSKNEANSPSYAIEVFD